MEDPHYLNWLHSSAEIRCFRANSGNTEMEYFVFGKKPRLFISSGMHGDEYGVVASVSRALNTYMNKLPGFLYIPIANKAGVKKKQRDNARGLDINRGFNQDTSTDESRIMMELLQTHKFDLSVSFHEDPEFSELYMYDFVADNRSHDISHYFEQFKSKLSEMGISMFNGIDDAQDIHLGNVFIDGYKIFKKEDVKRGIGQLEEWLLENSLSQRIFNPEIPQKIDQKLKDKIVDVFFNKLIITFF